MEFRKNDILTLDIEDCGVDGEGIGKADGFTVFVKDAVIGDRIKAKIIKAKKNYGYGRLMEVITPSPYRVKPACSIARQCGGCQIQALSYEEQLKFKEKKVRDHLERIGGFKDLEMEPIMGMEEPYHYRNKAQFPVGKNKDGKIITGFLRRKKRILLLRTGRTMVRMCRCFEGIEYADSYVTLTGIMFSLTYENKTITRICRVHTGEVDLNRIDQINTLSRSICTNPISVDELANELEKIKKISRYTFKETMFFGAVGAAGFGIFFNGTLLEIVMSFFIGILIRCISCFLSKHKLNSFLNNAISAGSAALSAQLIHQVLPQTNVDIMVISSFMLLVPGLAITNAIRDTIAGDYVSGVARAADAFLCAVAIAVGAGFVMYFWI